MSSSNSHSQNQNTALDYLCVDIFIANIVEARALGTAFQLGIIDYIEENQHSTFDNLAKKFNFKRK